MTSNKDYQSFIIECFEKANLVVPNFNVPTYDNSTALYGTSGAVLDSMTLVHFVFLIEEEVEKKFKKKIKITTQEVLDQDSLPFSNITTLAAFIEKKIS